MTSSTEASTAAANGAPPLLESLVSQLLQEVGILKQSANDEDDQAGIDIGGGTNRNNTNNDILFHRMDQWMGMTTNHDAPELTPIMGALNNNNDKDEPMDTTDDDTPTIEDCAPFDPKIYEILAKLVLQAWNPDSSSSTGGSASSTTPNTNNNNPYANPFVQEFQRLQASMSRSAAEDTSTRIDDLAAARMTLNGIPAIRVTKWIRQWMDCNLEGPNPRSSTETKTASTLAYHLLQTSVAVPLFQALFLHLSHLSTYHSQLLLFQQAFQRGDYSTLSSSSSQQKGKHSLQTSSNKPITTTTTTTEQRLHHYQIAQQLSQRLTCEFQHHIQSLQTILGDWYRASHAALRSLARAGLARVWYTFLKHNTSTTTSKYATSLKGENTSASGLDVTLQCLYRILLGMPVLQAFHQNRVNQTPLLEDLLWYQLLPLHQPSAMVLWRDQTSLLELYHEPLVQCMALILKANPVWIGPVCQALLTSHGGSAASSSSGHPHGTSTASSGEGIWPVGGNTPKQVLLLHEVDTFLGMLLVPKHAKHHSSDKQPQEVHLVLDETTFGAILTTAAQCMASEHSRLAERALTLFRNAYFKRMVYEDHYEASLRILLPALTRSNNSSSLALGNGGPSMPSMKYAIPWNPTVRKMTFHVLKNLQQHNPASFAKLCNQIFGSRVEQKVPASERPAPSPKSSLLVSSLQTAASSAPVFNQRFSLQAGMGDWRPPPKQDRAGGGGGATGRHTNMPPPSARPPSKPQVGQQPPLSVTGVAPWAAKPPVGVPGKGKAPWATSAGSNIIGYSNKIPPSSKKNPPSTITGVAPWAMSPSGSLPPPASQRRPGVPLSAPMPAKSEKIGVPSSSSMPVEPEETPSVPESTKSTADEEASTPQNKEDNAGLDHVLHYMDQCKPQGMDEDADEHAASSWSKSQMEETPTLLPDLKFHDLVFGHELGAGAFGVVKYARLIDRAKTRSFWPEYAVKVIATEKMKELGYEYSVAREIACLHLVSHPNVARLVSSFRFQQGAYLVLEYASGGDLHQLLQQHGSLDSPSCQFVLGEIVAALASLHDDLGFVYGDLKPENIVLSETGHVKLTDFGACRPYTEQARAMLDSQMGKSGKNLLETLREGDPRKVNRPAAEASATLENMEEEEEEPSVDWGSTDDVQAEVKKSKVINDDMMEVAVENKGLREDLRIEGTVAYLPPEVVLGAIPTPAADSWALGCVLYQCLSGRPPILEADEATTRNRIVTFESKTQLPQENDPLFGTEQKHAADISDEAKSLIRALLERVPNERPTMQQVAEHEFFGGQDVLRLYQKPAYPLDVGKVAPGPPDAQWSRRQFSSIWAPQPRAYDISGDGSNGSLAQSIPSEGSSAPIAEGNEAGSPFAASHFYRGSLTFKTKNAPKEGPGSNSGENADVTADLAHQPLGQIEEDDASMASVDAE